MPKGDNASSFAPNDARSPQAKSGRLLRKLCHWHLIIPRTISPPTGPRPAPWPLHSCPAVQMHNTPSAQIHMDSLPPRRGIIAHVEYPAINVRQLGTDTPTVPGPSKAGGHTRRHTPHKRCRPKPSLWSTGWRQEPCSKNATRFPRGKGSCWSPELDLEPLRSSEDDVFHQNHANPPFSRRVLIFPRPLPRTLKIAQLRAGLTGTEPRSSARRNPTSQSEDSHRLPSMQPASFPRNILAYSKKRTAPVPFQGGPI